MISFKSKCLAACVVLLASWGAHAQSWPPATVRIVVPYPPGTEPDVLARDLGVELGKLTGKSFVVENKPGANSIVGTGAVVKGEADGSTLLMVDRLAVVTNPMLYDNVPYKWEKDLKPVSDLAGVNLFIGVRSALPFKTFAEFEAYARANPKKLNVGTGGIGHVSHIGMEMLSQADGLSFTYAPYKGLAPAIMGLLTDEVDVVMAGGLPLVPHVQTGKVRVLTVGADKRASFLPDVPTLVEAGGKPGSIPATVFALFAPGSVPDTVVAQINTAVVKAMDNPQIKESYAKRGLEVGTARPDAMLATMKADTVKYDRIIKEAGIKAH
ncbi:ABC transporter substrate-binding protein [Azoarcus sp. DD4]|uniref:Bug family tripartite tricarboxylate transporter substrate binding protein n=1 Tax=Azoarcus sp. DD4 TaxID=2027405 RepID=UPI00112D0DC5|nr:tripartite tricarboxylate transporter substrate binding protein [Azoarcus sp. DD4]QDF98023.1 ABC transporter substrate-binding protein [Azoarcus sp. DD4]